MALVYKHTSCAISVAYVTLHVVVIRLECAWEIYTIYKAEEFIYLHSEKLLILYLFYFEFSSDGYRPFKILLLSLDGIEFHIDLFTCFR